MTTDYDALRQRDADDPDDDALAPLKTRRANARSGTSDAEDTGLGESAAELGGLDILGSNAGELAVRVQPQMRDEFTCSSCYLVHHRSRRAPHAGDGAVCQDCAQLSPAGRRAVA